MTAAVVQNCKFKSRDLTSRVWQISIKATKGQGVCNSQDYQNCSYFVPLEVLLKKRGYPMKHVDVHTEFYEDPTYTMKGASGLSLLLLMVLGSCFGLQESLEDGEPWEKIQLWKILTDRDENIPKYLQHLANPRDKKSTDPASLFSVAKELQGFGKERAGFRFRFGRRDEGNDVDDFEPQMDKRVGTALGSLAEELNGYNRKKGGFSFRFGRR